MNGESEALCVRGISRRFGTTQVFSRISLGFRPGEIVLLAGANGAGKTTLLRILVGLLRPHEGTVEYSAGLRACYFGPSLMLYSHLTVFENLKFFAALVGEALDDEFISYWDLEPILHRRVAHLSKGQQARVSLVRTFLASSGAILLDEPTSALDDTQTQRLLDMVVARTRAGAFALIATHDIARVSPVVTRAIILEQGGCLDSQEASQMQTPEEKLRRYIDHYRLQNR